MKFENEGILVSRSVSGASAGSRFWFVVQTKPAEEERAERHLCRQGIETFLPLYRKRVFGEGWVLEGRRPLFPGYLFARFDVLECSRVNSTRGVRRVLGFGGGPLPVSDEVVEAIRVRVGVDGLIELDDGFMEGDRLEVVSGPLRGFSVVFSGNLSDAERVCVLLGLFGREVRVELPRWQLRRVID